MMGHRDPSERTVVTGLPWPNLVSAGRLVLLVPFVLMYMRVPSGDPAWRRLAFALFVVMALSDALDGYLARRLNRRTRLGAVLDPLADKLLVAASLVLLSLPQTAVPGFRIPVWVPAVAIAKDVVAVLGLWLLHIRGGGGPDGPRPLGKLCTVAQFLLVILVLLAPDVPLPLEQSLPAVWWAASGLAAAALLDYVRAGIGASKRPPESQL